MTSCLHRPEKKTYISWNDLKRVSFENENRIKIVTIERIKDKIRTGKYRFSDHAVKRMIKRAINRYEIEDAVIAGEIIEEYPEDKYSPSCLVYGKTRKGRNLHIQLSLPPAVVIITVYEPDESEWIDCKVRR